MPTVPRSKPAAEPSVTWSVDPSVLACRFGIELAVYHLRTGRSYTLTDFPEPIWGALERGLSREMGVEEAPREAFSSNESYHQRDFTDLLAMLEREQLIVRQGRAGTTARPKDEDGLFFIIRSEKANSSRVEHRRAREAPLYTDTLLQRLPEFTVKVANDHVRIHPGEGGGSAIEGGRHALRLLDAFERPHSIREVIRVLQRRVQEVRDWIGLVAALVRLFEGGALKEVDRGAGAARGRPDTSSATPP